MAVKCEMFLNGNKNLIGICKTNMAAKKEYRRDRRCERTNMANKCKLFEAVNLTLHGHYTHVCTVSKVVVINTENKICLPNKEYKNVH